MAVFRELFETRLALFEKEEELRELKLEYDNYKTIVESPCNNKNVRDTKEHISWYTPDELKKKAQEVKEEEWLEYSLEKARKQERKKRREEEKEKKKRAAERKALDELMEKERRERARKNKEAN